MEQESQYYNEMGRRIKTRRKEFRMKQNELAERLGISNNHMSSIENGREKPSLDTLISICNELNVTPDYFLLGNIHANNVTKDIVEGLRLCSEEDIDLIRQFLKIFIKRNSKKWNEDNFE